MASDSDLSMPPEDSLVAAASEGRVDAVAQLLLDGADIEDKNSAGCTALHMAAKHNKPDILAMLLSHGADVAARDCNGWTPLMFAAMNENEACVAQLLAKRVDSSTDIYQGGPLRAKDIRLLEILPHTAGEDVIRCLMTSTSLEDAKIAEYQALSYVWGPKSQSRHCIWVNDTPVDVGENLYIAIKHIGEFRGREPAKFWIDALCIRQDDNAEKSAQVAIMGEIYSCAKVVQIWLGPDKDGSENAIRVLEDRDLDAMVQTEFVSALSKLILRPWFSRIWTMQELCLYHPTAAWVRSGNSMTLWIWFSESVRVFFERCSSKSSLTRKIETSVLEDFSVAVHESLVLNLQRLRQRMWSDYSYPIPNIQLRNFPSLLLASRAASATDPRDKVYAVLGMTREAGGFKIRPDYSKSCETVMTEATTNVLLAYKTPALSMFLTYPTLSSSMKPSQSTSASCPSWVLDFSFTSPRYAQHFVMAPRLEQVSLGGSQLHIDFKEKTMIVFASFLGSLKSIVGQKQPVSASTIAAKPGQGSATIESTVSKLNDSERKLQENFWAFLVKAQESSDEASRAASWWALQGIDPLWKTLIGGAKRFQESDTAKFSSAEAQRRFDILKAQIGPSGPLFSAAGSEDVFMFRNANYERILGQASPLPTDIFPSANDINRGDTSFYATEHGTCGLCKAGAREGDSIAVLFRGYEDEMAFVLRKSGEDNMDGTENTYTIVSIASVPSNWADLVKAQGLWDTPMQITIK